MNPIGIMHSNVTGSLYIFFEELRDAMAAEEALSSDQVSESDKRELRHEIDSLGWSDYLIH